MNMNKSKPLYKLRLKDIIPLVGMNNYNERCRWEAISHLKPEGENPNDYYRKCFARKLVLGSYNSVLVAGTAGGAFFGLVGLVKLVFG